jgi:hypothetical protein
VRRRSPKAAVVAPRTVWARADCLTTAPGGRGTVRLRRAQPFAITDPLVEASPWLFEDASGPLVPPRQPEPVPAEATVEKMVCVEAFQTWAVPRGRVVNVGCVLPADSPIVVSGARFFRPVEEPAAKE